jgi:hypothetical protein
VTAYGGATGGITDGSILESMLISSEEGTAVPTNTMTVVHQLPGLFVPQYSVGSASRPAPR